MAKPTGGLTEWFGKGPKGDWVDIGAKRKKESFKSVGVSLLKAQKENTLNVYLDQRQAP